MLDKIKRDWLQYRQYKGYTALQEQSLFIFVTLKAWGYFQKICVKFTNYCLVMK
ncbi:hypothetical protein HMPREF2534_01779 [Bacteroides thetaiotaomicron]|nr:hypothetical protein HMPREF2534_01779 [Bacteroides thetaiotaomicron]